MVLLLGAIIINFGVYLFLKKKRQDINKIEKHDEILEENSQMTAASTIGEDENLSISCSPSTDPISKLSDFQLDYEQTDPKDLKSCDLFVISEEQSSFDSEK